MVGEVRRYQFNLLTPYNFYVLCIQLVNEVARA